MFLFAALIPAFAPAASSPPCASTVERVFAVKPSALDGLSVGPDFLVTVDSYGLSVWDTEDPTAINHVGSWLDWGQGYRNWEFEVDERGYLLAGDYDEITVFDIRGPQGPSPVASIPVWSDNFDIEGNILAAVGNGGLKLVDITNPARPSFLCNNCMQFGPSLGKSVVEIYDDIVFVTIMAQLYIIDISNPESPVEVARINGNYIDWDSLQEIPVIVGDGFLVLPRQRTVIDISDLHNPIVHERFSGYFGYHPFIIGHVVYGVSLGILKAVDFSELDTPIILEPIDLQLSGTIIEGAEVNGTHLFVLDEDQIHVFDAGDGFQRIGTSDDPGAMRDFDVDGNLAVVANNVRGIDIYSLEQPKPHMIGHLSFENELTDYILLSASLAVVGCRKYIDERYSKIIRLIDLTDPQQPAVLSTIGDSDFEGAYSIFVDPGFLLVSGTFESEPGIAIFDISNPAVPERVSWTPIDTVGNDLIIDGSLLFIGRRNSVIFIVDIATPSAPKLLSSVNVSYETFFPIDDILVVFSYQLIDLIDVSDPINPNLIESLQNEELTYNYPLTNSSTDGPTVAMVNNYLYLVDFSIPTEPVFRRYYPKRPGFVSEIDSGILYLLADPYLEVVQLECVPPKAESSWIQSGLDVWFRSTSGYAVGTAYGTVRSRDLHGDFGDGDYNSFSTWHHTYSEAGTYVFTLEVGNEWGRDRLSRIISVRDNVDEVSPVRRGGIRAP